MAGYIGAPVLDWLTIALKRRILGVKEIEHTEQSFVNVKAEEEISQAD
jgi:hypothetical protein